MSVTAYTAFQDISIAALTAQITTAIAGSWQPYGSPLIRNASGDQPVQVLVQPMVQGAATTYTNYEFLQDPTPTGLAAQIATAIGAGWALYGNTLVREASGDNPIQLFVQAMTKGNAVSAPSSAPIFPFSAKAIDFAIGTTSQGYIVSGGHAGTLPLASAAPGVCIIIAPVGSNANVNLSGADTIANVQSFVTVTIAAPKMFVSDGVSNWSPI